MKPTYQIVLALVMFLFVLFILLATQKEALAAFTENIRLVFR